MHPIVLSLLEREAVAFMGGSRCQPDWPVKWVCNGAEMDVGVLRVMCDPPKLSLTKLLREKPTPGYYHTVQLSCYQYVFCNRTRAFVNYFAGACPTCKKVYLAIQKDRRQTWDEWLAARKAKK
jgi:hypothetical protein